MNRVKQKLESRDGVSILIALVGFMVAAMVSIVIITQAVTSAKRVSTDETDILNRRALVTAAEYIQSGLEGTAAADATEYIFTDFTDSTHSTIKIDADNPAVVNGQIELLNTRLQTAIESNEVNSSATDYKSSEHGANFIVTLNASTGETDDNKTVDVSFIMTGGTDGKYDVIYTLEIDDQQLYLSTDGYCSSEKAADGNYHITWSVVSINGLGADT